MGKNQQYENAYSGYTKTINDYTKVSNDFYQDAYKNSKKYVGDEGYNRALELGKKGAVSASNASIANSVNNARASGMNKAQSATMGNQSAINTYGNQLNAQQQNAYSSGLDAVNNEYNRANGLATNEYNIANGISGTYANRANLAGQGMNSRQAEGSNIFTRAFGGSGAIGNALESLSDERLKKYKDISTSFCSNKEEKDDKDNILKYKIDITKYQGGK